LRKEDILEVVRYLMELKNGNGSVDDIDISAIAGCAPSASSWKIISASA
jgi:hypothetical protein